MSERVFIPGEDDEAVLLLRAKVWGADHRFTNAAYYKWLFHDTPDGPGAGIVSEKDGKVIGFAGLSHRKGQSGNNPIRIAHGLDFMVDPGLPGMLSGRVAIRVVHAHLKLVVARGFDCSLNYPNNNSHRMLVSKRAQFETVFEPDLYVRPLSAIRLSPDETPNAGKRAAVRLGAAFGAAYSGIRSIGASRDMQIDILDGFDERFDRLWPRLQADGKLRFTRDARTLNWRYFDHPVASYKVFAAIRNGDVEGYIVTCAREILGADARLICDFMVAGQQRDVQEALLSTAIDAARREGAELVATQMISHDGAMPALKRLGFVRVPARFNPKAFRMAAVRCSEKDDVIMQGANWSFRWGDMDVV